MLESDNLKAQLYALNDMCCVFIKNAYKCCTCAMHEI